MMNRRDFLTGAATGVVGTLASLGGHRLLTNGSVDVPGVGVINAGVSYDMEQQLPGNFDRMEIQPNGSALIYFDESHEFTGVVLTHASDSDYSDVLLSKFAPSFSGPLKIPLVGGIRSGPEMSATQSTMRFPNRKFALTGSNSPTWNSDPDFRGESTRYVFGLPKQFSIPLRGDAVDSN